MPVTHLTQARIEMTKAQAKAIGEICANALSKEVAIEETNLDGVLAVQTYGGLRLVRANGEVYKMDNAARKTKTTPRAGSTQRRPRTK
jgi:hypothetical protein